MANTGSLLFTTIARLGDGLPLAEDARPDPSIAAYRNQAKSLAKSLNQHSPTAVTFPVGDHTFHVIQKTKRLYADTRTQRNLDKLNSELADVQRIMTANIQDVLGRGEKLDTMTKLSSTLSSESKKYAKSAQYLNFQAMLQKYAPCAAVLCLVILVLLWKFYF